MKPRVVIRRVSDGQYRRGYGWTGNLQLARVFRSAGVAGGHCISAEGRYEYVPVELRTIEQAS